MYAWNGSIWIPWIFFFKWFVTNGNGKSISNAFNLKYSIVLCSSVRFFGPLEMANYRLMVWASHSHMNVYAPEIVSVCCNVWAESTLIFNENNKWNRESSVYTIHNTQCTIHPMPVLVQHIGSKSLLEWVRMYRIRLKIPRTDQCRWFAD